MSQYLPFEAELFNAILDIPNHNTISIRYDKLTPDIVHLKSGDTQHPIFRRVKGSTVEQIAQNIVFCPKCMHLCYDDDLAAELLLQMPERKRLKYAIIDIFRVDIRCTQDTETASSLIIQCHDQDTQDNADDIDNYVSKRLSTAEYYAVKTIRLITDNLRSNPISLDYFEIYIKPSYREKISRLLKENSGLFESFDILIKMANQPNQAWAMLVTEDLIINVLNLLFPGYFTPRQNMVDMIKLM